jgi:FkbM family methyltransferase
MRWTLGLVRRYWPYLTLPSVLALRGAIAGGRAGAIDVRLRSPPARLRFRPNTIDLSTFNDVFLRQIYRVVGDGPINTLIDLGANIGLVGLYVRASNPHAQIFALEPDADNFGLLEQNLPDATVRRGALWEEDGPVTFARNTPTTGRATATGLGDSVPGFTMATLVAQAGFPQIDLVKVDTEGGERHLFAGDHSWLMRAQRLVIEWHEDARATSGFDRIVPAAGFVVRELDDHTTYAHR